MKRLTYLFVCSLAIGSIVACKQESKFQIINGIVYDATMNNITLITGKGDTVNISTMDANRDKVCGVLLEFSIHQPMFRHVFILRIRTPIISIRINRNTTAWGKNTCNLNIFRIH